MNTTSQSKLDASAADFVFAGIASALEANRLVPGQRLVEVELVDKFGVSRNSVREALQRLQAEGVVEIVRHKGAVIRTLTAPDTMDILDVAERITGLLARSAARGIANGAASHPLVAALRKVGQAHDRRDDVAFGLARRQFYRALLQLGGSRELQRLFPLIQMPIIYAQYRIPVLPAIRLSDYRLIAQAVLRGDEVAADMSGAAHVRNVRREVLRIIGESDRQALGS